LAYFVAHTVYKGTQKPPLEDNFVTVQVIAAIEQNGGTLVGLYKLGEETFVSQIDLFLLLQVATKDKPVTMNSISVEQQGLNGWVLLRKIPSGGLRIFFGPPESAREISFLDSDIASFLYQDIDAGKTVKGFGIYQISDPNLFFQLPEGEPKFRVTITTALGQEIKVEAETRHRSADPFSAGGWQVKLINSKPLDLLQFKSRRYFSR